MSQPRQPSGDKLLLTPGPLTTSAGVKRAMLRDLGSRDAEFVAIVQRVRDELLRLAGASQEDGFECVLMQGSGTFGVEAALSTTVPRDGMLLALANGAYGERIARIAEVLTIETEVLRSPEDEALDLAALDRALAGNPGITTVAAVHCETSTGMLHPVAEIGAVVRKHGRLLFVDSMSAFGAVPVHLERDGIDVLVSSANKCIEGVPGFSFALCRRDVLAACAGRARSLSLDLHAQWLGLERDGQFRFTPPTHAILAFDQALRELEEEGGVQGRGARYRANYDCLVQGMRALGFRELLAPELQGAIITSFHYPASPEFTFDAFYGHLARTGFLIYPGKVTGADCFRVGNIGRIFEEDVRAFLDAVRATLAEMGVDLAGAQGP